ncbi:MAG: manganese/iron transport system permease protein [Chloroflexota bacterium]|jgi:manganese/iron transport system permease protein|nr:manganese/iron transport system permease protein [Chloroflexota bacterium]
MDFIGGPISFELTRRALFDASLLGIACGVLGVFVVLRGLPFISDALSHCLVPGVVVAYLTHTSQELWGGAAALLSAWGIAALVRRGLLGSDPAIAVVFSTMFALGLALISVTRSYLNDLTEILFGQILAVTPADLVVCAAITLVVVATVALLYWPLVMVSFDPAAAQAQGLPVERLDLTLYTLIALAIVPGFVAVGSLLVTALLIVPAATARLLARRVATQMVVSAGLAVAASWIGIYASYYSKLATGGAIVVAAGLLFIAALVASPQHGLIARLSRRATARRALALES